MTTTKEQFIIDAQVYYYINECNSDEIFDLMDSNVKDAVITAMLEDYSILVGECELDYLVHNNETLLLYYFNDLIDSGEELCKSHFSRLTTTQMGIWYNMLHKTYIEDGCEEEWKTHWIVDLYRQIRAEHRDNQINSILND